jgi:predicted nucleotidyltransferase
MRDAAAASYWFSKDSYGFVYDHMVTKKFIYPCFLPLAVKKETKVGGEKARQLRKTGLMELNDSYNKVMFWFFSFPNKEMSLSDLASQLKISKVTANRVVRQLVQEKFLKVEVLGRIWRVSCDNSHVYNYSRKIGYNLMMVYESGLVGEVLKLIENPKAIILFGSYRKGDDSEKSDIDLAVEVLDNKGPRIIELGIIPRLGFRENVPVHLHVFSRSKADLNLFSNIANGIVLYGFLEARP